MTRKFASAPFAVAISVVAALSLAACSDAAENTDQPLTEDELVVPVDETPYVAPTAANAPSAIPAAMHGRWGLVAADCTSTMGDAKGLLEINGTRLKFFESVGTLGPVSEGDDDEIRANFAFTGEGMEWTREIELELEEDGKVLIRKEYGQDAAPAPLRYTRCA